MRYGIPLDRCLPARPLMTWGQVSDVLDCLPGWAEHSGIMGEDFLRRILDGNLIIDFNDNRLTIPVSKLDLSTRPDNHLRRMDIRHVGELIQRSEQNLLKTKNLGRKSLWEIKNKLLSLDLCLGMIIVGWESPAETTNNQSQSTGQ